MHASADAVFVPGRRMTLTSLKAWRKLRSVETSLSALLLSTCVIHRPNRDAQRPRRSQQVVLPPVLVTQSSDPVDYGIDRSIDRVSTSFLFDQDDS